MESDERRVPLNTCPADLVGKYVCQSLLCTQNSLGLAIREN